MSRAPGGTPAQRTMLAALNDRADDDFAYTISQITTVVSRKIGLAPPIPNREDWEIPDGWVDHFAVVISTRSWWNAGNAERHPNLMLLFIVAEGGPLLPEYADRVLRQNLCNYIDYLIPRNLHHASEAEQDEWIGVETERHRVEYLDGVPEKHPLHAEVASARRNLRQDHSLWTGLVRRDLSRDQRAGAIAVAKQIFPVAEGRWSKADEDACDAESVWGSITDTILKEQALDNAIAAQRLSMKLRFGNPLKTLTELDFTNEKTLLHLAIGVSKYEQLPATLSRDDPRRPREWFQNEKPSAHPTGVHKLRNERLILTSALGIQSALAQPPMIAIRDYLESASIPVEVVSDFRSRVADLLSSIRVRPELHAVVFGEFALAFGAYLMALRVTITVTREPFESGGFIETLTTSLEADQ